jgi:hypothetical protein
MGIIETAGMPRVASPKRVIAALRFGSVLPHVSGAGERPRKRVKITKGGDVIRTSISAITYRKGVCGGMVERAIESTGGGSGSEGKG